MPRINANYCKHKADLTIISCRINSIGRHECELVLHDNNVDKHESVNSTMFVFISSRISYFICIIEDPCNSSSIGTYGYINMLGRVASVLRRSSENNCFGR